MVRFTVEIPTGSYSVDIDNYQWGYTEGEAFVTRDFGELAYGTWFRERVQGVTSRVLEVRFVQTDEVMRQLRTLSAMALRYGQRVQFFPDTTDLGTFRWIDWQESQSLKREIENRAEQVLRLVEQPA